MKYTMKEARVYIKKWETLEVEDLSPSKWLSVFRHTVKLPNGKVIDDFYVYQSNDAVMILPITKDGKVIFVRQYKHGSGEITIELPAGMVEDDVSPDKQVRMELKEETGYVADKLVELGKVGRATTKEKFKHYYYLATGLDNPGSTSFDENEQIETIEVPLSKLDDFCLSNNLPAETYALIYIAKTKYPELFAANSELKK